MSQFLRVTIRFLEPRSHSRRDGSELEWPPSPLRVFQALVAAAAGVWNERRELSTVRDELSWLECRPLRAIVASPAVVSKVKCQFYVPDNTADLLVAAWKRGEVDKAPKRTEKVVQPVHLAGDPTVHYLYHLPPEGCPHLERLREIARSITHLGWGIDMAVGDADLISEADANVLEGERWFPVKTGGTTLRVPKVGTLDDLCRRHAAFLGRVTREGFRPVPGLSVFDIVSFRNETDLTSPAWVAFKLLTPDAERSRPFNPRRGTRELAGMLRHALRTAAEENTPVGWTQADVNRWVHGKSAGGESRLQGDSAPDRFSYLPLPTINAALNRVESIRRVLVAFPAHAPKQYVEWIRRSLSGTDLIDEKRGEPTALLTLEKGSDWVVQRYTLPAPTWSTVTPVILPGYDDPGHYRRRLQKGDLSAADQRRLLDRLDDRIVKLIQTAMRQAGWSEKLIESTGIDYRRVGFHAGVDMATAYLPPDNLQKFSRYHVSLRFPAEVAGPIALGSGRFRGFGLFASHIEKRQSESDHTRETQKTVKK